MNTTFFFSKLWTPILLVSILSLCPSCVKYRLVSHNICEGPVPVSIPIIYHDDNGIFRNLLAKEISLSPDFVYKNRSSISLKLTRVEDEREVFGYMWDRDPISGVRQDRLYPSEERRYLTYKVELIDEATEKEIVPSFTVSTSNHYDFVNPTSLRNIEFTLPDGSEQTVLQFSMGQLDSEEGAQSQSFISDYQSLARHIVFNLTKLYTK